MNVTTNPAPDLTRRTVILVLTAMIALQVILHLPFLHKPPMGQHVWRQVVGHAMARNYYMEDDRLFHPRNDIRISANHDGRIWHEFPLVYWLIGKSYVYTGFQHLNARLIWLFFSLTAIPVAYFFLRRLDAARPLALLFAYAFSFVPYYFYYSISLVPNLHALIYFLFGTGFYLGALRNGSFNKELWIGTLFLALATISKPTYLFFGLATAFLCWKTWRQRGGWRTIGQASITAMIVGTVNLLVIRHAKILYEQAPAEQRVHTPIGPAEAPESLSHILENVGTALTAWFGEMFIGFAALPLFVAGLVQVIRGRERLPQPGFWWAWLASFIIFASLFVVRFADHDYYINSLLPVSAIFIAVGASSWLRSAKTRKWALLFLTLMPVVMVARTYKRWSTNAQVPTELLQDPAAISRLIPENERVLVLGDRTPIVFLYFLQRKGLAEGERVSRQRLDQLNSHGIEWLVAFMPRADLSAISEALREVGQVGKFKVFRIATNE